MEHKALQPHLLELLNCCLQKQDPVRRKAEKDLMALLDTAPADFVQAASQILQSQQIDPAVRQLAGLLFKKIVFKSLESWNNTAWLQLKLSEQESVCEDVLSVLATDDQLVRRGASSAVATIASFQLEKGEWSDLLPSLKMGLSHPSISFKKSAILTIGKLCQDLNPVAVSETEAKSLFQTLLKQLSQCELKQLTIEAIVVAVPFASITLAQQEEFSMNLTNSVFSLVMHKEEEDIQVLQEAWKALDALAHYFYFSFYDKVYAFVKAALDELFNQQRSDTCALLALQALYSLINEEYERKRRGLELKNFIKQEAKEVSFLLCSAVEQIAKSSLSADLDSLQAEALNLLVQCIQNTVELQGQPMLDYLHQELGKLHSESPLACVCLATCCIVQQSPTSSQPFIKDNFTYFADLLSENSPVLIKQLHQFFEHAFQIHYSILFEQSKLFALIDACSYCTKRPTQIALPLMKILLEIAVTAKQKKICISSFYTRLIEIGFECLDRKDQDQNTLHYRARDMLLKVISNLKDNDSIRFLQAQFIPTLLTELEQSIKDGGETQIEARKKDVRDLKLELLAQAILTVKQIQDSVAEQAVHLVLQFFLAYEVPTAQGLLLYNAVINQTSCDKLPHFQQIIEGVYYAVQGGCGNRVMFDALLVMGSIPQSISDHSSPLVKEMVDKMNEVVRGAVDLNILTMAVDGLSYFTHYCYESFRMHALKTAESFDLITRKIRTYWESKSGKPFFTFDQDDAQYLQLFKTMIEAYSCLITGAYLGQWVTRILDFGNRIVAFFAQATEVMYSALKPEEFSELGFLFAQILQAFQGTVVKQYKERTQFFSQLIVKMNEQIDELRDAHEENSEAIQKLMLSASKLADAFEKHELELIIYE